MENAGAGLSMAGLRMRLLVLCFPLALLLSGCGTVAIALVNTMGGMLIADAVGHDARAAARAAADARDMAVAGMDGSPIDYPIAAVYRELVRAAESDGLKIIDSDEPTYTLVVSYPFSLARNTWGGQFTVTCVVEGVGTRVQFQSNGNDAMPRVRKIEATMLDGALKALRQPNPRS